MSLPLDDVLVVSVEQAVAVPLATRKMADAGARVVKVERPGGDFARGYDAVVQGDSTYFVWLNRGKESVVADLKDGEDAAFLNRLIECADVFVQNLAPGAAARLGFGSGDLRRAYPRLVTCDVTGYGERGPYARMKAYDSLVQGEAGLEAVTGTPDAPARVGISICDIAAGMHVYAGVLEALRQRDRTGEGAALEVSLFDAIADWMAVPYLHHAYGEGAPERAGLRHPGIAPYGPFTSREGDTVLVAVQNEREWARLCADVLGRPDVATDPRFADNPGRVANREALEELLQTEFGALTTVEATDRLERAAVAFGRVRSVEAFADHPQLRLMDVEGPHGTVRLPADPVVWRERADWPGASGAGAPAAPGPPRPTVPALDEHGASLRAEFGT